MMENNSTPSPEPVPASGPPWRCGAREKGGAPPPRAPRGPPGALKKTPGLAVHYQSVRATQTDFPILTCAAARTADGTYRFAIGARPMKAMLVCPTAAPDELPAAVQAAVPTGSNLRGSAAYRTHLVGVLVKRAVQALGNLEVL